MAGAYRFELGARLGRGGFGEVYRATRGGAGALVTDVAVKVLRAPTDADAIARLSDEARMLARLDHPAILKVLDLVVLDGMPALVAEYVEGADVDALVPLRPRAAIEVAVAIADGLAEAHAAGLVHRDVKPKNVRIGRHGQVKLLDFGIAWAAPSTRDARTRSGVMVGSAPYLAPERFADGPPTAAADVYGLGCVLFEALAGRSFAGGKPLATLAMIASHRSTFDQHVIDAIPATDARARPLLRRLLAFAPADRPSAAEASAAAEQIAASMAGVGLRAFCRSYAWPAPTADAGPLTGRVIVGEPFALRRP